MIVSTECLQADVMNFRSASNKLLLCANLELCLDFVPAGSFLTHSSVYRISWASLFLCLSLSLRLIAPERCVMSAETFLLALLMWQFEGCDYVVSQVTDGCRGGLYSVCLTHVVTETETQLTMLVCKVMQCLQCCVCGNV